MRRLTTHFALALALAGGAFMVQAQEAEAQIGAEIVFADDLDLGVGLRYLMDVDAFEGEDSVLEALWLIFEGIYYLDPFNGCDNCSAFELNANGAVPLDLSETADLYAGAGINVTRFSIDTGVDVPGFDFSASSTDVGLNIFGGINFILGSLSAFGEAGIQVGGGEQFQVKGGVLFGN